MGGAVFPPCYLPGTSLVAQMVKCLSTMWETRVRSLGWEDPLEKEMAIHSSTLAWKILWMEEPGGLQSMGSQRVTWLSNFTSLTSLASYFINGEGNGNPLQYSCLENPMDRGAWQAMVHGVTKSWIWLRWLSNASAYLRLLIFLLAILIPACD